MHFSAISVLANAITLRMNQAKDSVIPPYRHIGYSLFSSGFPKHSQTNHAVRAKQEDHEQSRKRRAQGRYRRVLPSPPAIAFSSLESKTLFCEALKDGRMESFCKLIYFYDTQSEPTFCGLSTLSMTLNALGIVPNGKWKGKEGWRDWMLERCVPELSVNTSGISFYNFIVLARSVGAITEAFYTNQCGINDFRRFVMKYSSSEDCFVISSYHRAALQQSGTGHFTSIGGYHAGKDMVLILDVARYKYPPHWVPLTLLWEGMTRVDDTTGLPRGFLLISRPHIDHVAVAGLCRRLLPVPPAIELASLEGKRLFREALGQGTMEAFFDLASYFQTQSEPACSGLATLSMVLNALSIDPGRIWKGPWRWFDETILYSNKEEETILYSNKEEEIMFFKIAYLAQENGADVQAFQSTQSSMNIFRKHIISCTTCQDHYLVSNHKPVFNQTRTDYFSPIGGYHIEMDMVLILDVARFQHPPHWLSLSHLWTTMHAGYMIVSKLHRAPSNF